MCESNVRIGEFVFSPPRSLNTLEQWRRTECFGHGLKAAFGLWSLSFELCALCFDPFR
jgi:hypothetical protein